MNNNWAVDGITAIGTTGSIGMYTDRNSYWYGRNAYVFSMEFWAADDDEWFDSSEQDKTFKLGIKMGENDDSWQGVKMEFTSANSSDNATQTVNWMRSEGMEIIGAGETLGDFFGIVTFYMQSDSSIYGTKVMLSRPTDSNE